MSVYGEIKNQKGHIEDLGAELRKVLADPNAAPDAADALRHRIEVEEERLEVLWDCRDADDRDW